MFRGEDGQAYALDAYCPHSGANLALGGQVKYSHCVQCPFHGWVFDGKSGNLVAGNNLIPRKAENYEYVEDFSTCLKNPEEVLKKTGEGVVKIRKYPLREMYGFILLWLHADPNAEITYEPLDISDIIDKLDYRGVSRNKVYAHIQDIAENGGDIRHFVYVHSYLLPFTKLIGAQWDAKWLRGDDPDLKTKMKHKIAWVNDRKMKLIDRFINEKNASSIGVMSLDMEILFPMCSPLFFFNGTIFQVGSGLVYLFLASPFYDAVFYQHLTSIDNFEHDLYQDLYISSYLPNWLTALIIRLEAQQVTNDTLLWSNKMFTLKPTYVMQGDADKTILEWRRWFSQFYEGCAKRQAEREKFTW